MNIIVQRISKVRELPEVVPGINGIPELVQITVEYLAKNAAGGVADHGDGKGSVLHYVRAEPHCTLLCASWDSAVSMRQTQDLECRI